MVSSDAHGAADQRVLIWAAARDGALTRSFLSEAGFQAHACTDWNELTRELARGVGVLIIAGELLGKSVGEQLRSIFNAQPAWSDIPLIVVGGRAQTDADFAELVENLGNVSLLHRPLSVDTLCSTVSAALRARRRQYQVRELLHQREEADRRREEFLAMLAHELRNPLAPIRTGLEVLRVSDSKHVIERMREVIERQVGNLSRMIDDLLDVSRITRGKIFLQREPLNVAHVIRQAIDGHARLAAEKGIALSLDIGPAEMLFVDADPTRLEQMLGNVLTNAIKFTPPRGSIHIAAGPEGKQVRISIKDSGIGIPPAMLGQVFELFAQTDRPLDRSQGGLGIGLTVVKSLAELHGGSVQALSEGEGCGTEIVIKLPALARDIALPQEAGRDSDAKLDRSGRRRVLLIEDNRDAAEVLATYLRSLGHHVSVAYDGKTGMAAALRDRPDVVICDIGLPGVDGYELARVLRAEPALKRCLFVAVTGYGESRDRERGLEAGFQHYFTKPANPQEIARLLQVAPTEALA
jgi:signal transduction histidine kinase/ActR/RegA family two-component response regulator